MLLNSYKTSLYNNEMYFLNHLPFLVHVQLATKKVSRDKKSVAAGKLL
jgi:hypothetical protein